MSIAGFVPERNVTSTRLHRLFEHATSSRMGRGGQDKMLILLLVVLLLMSLGSLPTWRHSRDWGYYPSSGLGLIVVVLLVLLLLGRI